MSEAYVELITNSADRVCPAATLAPSREAHQCVEGLWSCAQWSLSPAPADSLKLHVCIQGPSTHRSATSGLFYARHNWV